VKKEWRLVDGVKHHAADAAAWDGFLSGAPHDTEGTMVSMSKVVGTRDALEEDARPVVAKLNLRPLLLHGE
jgi:hypothetical protein